MKFTEHRDSNVNVVKHYQPGVVKVNANAYQKSLFLTQQNVFENWPITKIEALTKELLDSILDTGPEVIILGTGEIQTFPSPEFFAYCSSKGIGLEVMANDAACRTFNVISTEDRDVVLALIFE